MPEKVTVVFDDGEVREYDFPTKEEVDAEYEAFKEDMKSHGMDVDVQIDMLEE